MVKTWILFYLLWGSNTGDTIELKRETFHTEQACLETQQFLKDHVEDNDADFKNQQEHNSLYVRREVVSMCLMDYTEKAE